jgi:GNAT superfamily N-acetyltransferase
VLIQLAESDDQVLGCFPVLLQLRPQLKPEEFLAQVRRQQQDGYQLAAIYRDHEEGDHEEGDRYSRDRTDMSDQIVGVAGFCLSECLAYGKFLYVYDLVVDETARSHGYGRHLFNWLVEYAKLHDCQQLHLDSGVQRFGAHRFYFQQQMHISSHHFALRLQKDEG